MDPGISHRDMPGYFFVLTVYTVIFILSLCVAGMMGHHGDNLYFFRVITIWL